MTLNKEDLKNKESLIDYKDEKILNIIDKFQKFK